jgi:hypothetical protein
MNQPAVASGPWRTSSRSQEGQCVALRTWRKSSSSSPNVGACVQLAGGSSDVGQPLLGVRDSKSPRSGVLVLPDAARLGLLAFASHR